MNGRTNAVAGTKLPALSNPAGAGQILSGYEAIGADGEVITGSIPSQGAQTITPGTANKTIAAGRYLSGTQTIAGDADLVAGNIKSGVNLFGVNGNYSGSEVVYESLSGSSDIDQVIVAQYGLKISSAPKKVCGLCMHNISGNMAFCVSYPSEVDEDKLYWTYTNQDGKSYAGYGTISLIDGIKQIGVVLEGANAPTIQTSNLAAGVIYIPSD